ncbi:MAG: V-type H+-transporting ATPase subunit [Geobacteraceae bacterium]|nr:MAG: V-type H+-transporting ATPase subunit [Geobacteraceae bacterium]
MGYQELIEALRREGEEKAGAIRREAEAEAERTRSEAEAGLALLREEHAKRQAVAVAEKSREILAEAESKGRLIRLAAESVLAERLYELARRSLRLLREQGYEALFAALAEELPPVKWETVRVNPADEEPAGRHFPAAEIVTDNALTGGMEVSGEGGRLCIVNTLEKRLERGWPEILPGLFRDVCKEV